MKCHWSTESHLHSMILVSIVEPRTDADELSVIDSIMRNRRAYIWVGDAYKKIAEGKSFGALNSDYDEAGSFDEDIQTEAVLNREADEHDDSDEYKFNTAWTGSPDVNITPQEYRAIEHWMQWPNNPIYNQDAWPTAYSKLGPCSGETYIIFSCAITL